MSNQYNVIVPSGPEYPSQEYVDAVLNGIDAIPTCSDLEKRMDMGEAAAKAYIAEKLNEAQAKFTKMFQDTSASLTRRMQPLADLIEPPDNLDDVLEYLGKVADYFKKPYTQMLDMVTFYSQFSAAVATALANKASDTGCLVPNGGVD